jgi:alpha-N-arabinofuranosidase
VGSFLASATDMERFIDAVVATCDHVGAALRSPKRIEISFDEWNVWYMNRPRQDNPPEWTVAPRLLEEIYTVTDAVVVGSLLISLLRRCDRVTAACLAQLVNVIGPILTEPGGAAWRQTTFYPFAQAATHGRGKVLQTVIGSPTYETAKFGDVALLHATAVKADDGTVTVFAVNRDLTRPMRLSIDVPALKVLEHLVLADPDRHAINTAESRDRVTPRPYHATHHATELPPLSWNMIRLG